VASPTPSQISPILPDRLAHIKTKHFQDMILQHAYIDGDSGKPSTFSHALTAETMLGQVLPERRRKLAQLQKRIDASAQESQELKTATNALGDAWLKTTTRECLVIFRSNVNDLDEALTNGKEISGHGRPNAMQTYLRLSAKATLTPEETAQLDKAKDVLVGGQLNAMKTYLDLSAEAATLTPEQTTQLAEAKSLLIGKATDIFPDHPVIIANVIGNKAGPVEVSDFLRGIGPGQSALHSLFAKQLQVIITDLNAARDAVKAFDDAAAAAPAPTTPSGSASATALSLEQIAKAEAAAEAAANTKKKLDKELEKQTGRLAREIAGQQENFGYFEAVAEDRLLKEAVGTHLLLESASLKTLEQDYKSLTKHFAEAEAKMGVTSADVESFYHLQTGHAIFVSKKDNKTVGISMPKDNYWDRNNSTLQREKGYVLATAWLATVQEKSKTPQIDGTPTQKCAAYVMFEMLTNAKDPAMVDTNGNALYTFKLDHKKFPSFFRMLMNDEERDVARKSTQELTLNTERVELMLAPMRDAEEHDRLRKIIDNPPTDAKVRELTKKVAELTGKGDAKSLAAAEKELVTAKTEYDDALEQVAEAREKLQEPENLARYTAALKCRETIVSKSQIHVADSKQLAALSGGSATMSKSGELTADTKNNHRVVRQLAAAVAPELVAYHKLRDPSLKEGLDVTVTQNQAAQNAANKDTSLEGAQSLPKPRGT